MALIQAKTNYGIVEGVRGNNQGVTVFKGIPYAAAPVGRLRFAPPQKPESWTGVRLCDRWPKTCVQFKTHGEFYAKEFYPVPKETDEDCLYLNIWTPAVSPEEKLPVLFWIHGGGFGSGFSYEQEFDGEAMCKRGCVQVTIEYRCNSFGFFAHQRIKEAFGHTGNQGLLDQIAALRWVHENIAAFGGDPKNITVHGQSAGAMSTRMHLTSPLCRGMVNRVIIQSGGGLNEWSTMRTEEEQMTYGVELLHLAKMTFDEVVTRPAEEVYTLLDQAARAAGGGLGRMGFHPCIDHYALLAHPGALIGAGDVNTDSILCGMVAGDAGIQTGCTRGISAEDRAIAFGSVVALGRHMNRNNRKPIYGYYFDHNLPGDDKGAWHSCELWYMFGTLGRCWRPWTGYDYVLSDAMVDYWCSFARCGDPNTEGRPRWPAYTEGTPVIMHFGDDGYAAENMAQTARDEAVISALGAF